MGASMVYGWESSSGNGFRLGLQDLLEANGTQTTMVGTQWSGNMSDNHHEAYLGITIDEFNNKSYHSGAYNLQANVVLVLIGTNDCWYTPSANSTTTTVDPRFEVGIGAASRFGYLLDSIRARAPDALVLASTLPRNANDWEDQCVQGFNSYLPAVVQNSVGQGQQARLVDMYDVVPLDQLQTDGTHPTDCGYQLMAQQWYAALVNATQDLCVERATNATESGSGTAVGNSSSQSGASGQTGTASPTPSTTKSTSDAHALLSPHSLWLLVLLATWAMGG